MILKLCSQIIRIFLSFTESETDLFLIFILEKIDIFKAELQYRYWPHWKKILIQEKEDFKNVERIMVEFFSFHLSILCCPCGVGSL